MQPKANAVLLCLAGVSGTASAFSKTELNSRRFGPNSSVVGGVLASSKLLECGHRSRDRRLISGVWLSSSGRGIGDESFPDDGEVLARQFYDHLKTRDATTAPMDENEEYRRLYGTDEGDEPETYELLPEEEARRRNRDPFTNRKEVRQGKYDIPTPLSSSPSKARGGRKFTGRSDEVPPRLDSTGTPSAGLFSGDGGSVYSIPSSRVRGGSSAGAGAASSSPRARMMQQEFNLVGRPTSERTLVAQAVVLLLFLSFSIYVGLSGGITDGSDRFGLEPSEFNALGEALDFGFPSADSGSFEEVVESATSKGGSVWL